MKIFKDRPTAWDYMMFIVARCGAAKSNSIISHEVIMDLFKDSEKEPDRNTISRLTRYHKELMVATAHRLNASLEQDGFFPKQGKGAKQKRWVLKVGPSLPIVESGKR